MQPSQHTNRHMLCSTIADILHSFISFKPRHSVVKLLIKEGSAAFQHVSRCRCCFFVFCSLSQHCAASEGLIAEEINFKKAHLNEAAAGILLCKVFVMCESFLNVLVSL